MFVKFSFREEIFIFLKINHDGDKSMNCMSIILSYHLFIQALVTLNIFFPFSLYIKTMKKYHEHFITCIQTGC